MSRHRLLLTLACLGFGCGGPQPPGVPNPDQDDCKSDISYQGIEVKGGAHVLNIASGDVAYHDSALREVNAEVEKFAQIRRSMCQDFRAGRITPSDYNRRSEELTARLLPVTQGVERIQKATSVQDRKEAFAKIYDSVVENASAKSLSASVTVHVRFPNELAGKLPERPPAGVTPVQVNDPVPTGAYLAFDVNVSRQAYVYLFQRSPNGSISALFPNPQMRLANPLQGTQHIPPSGDFEVTTESEGSRETVYVVVSDRPKPELDSALAQANPGAANGGFVGQVVNTDAAASECKTRSLEYKPSDCHRSRGLVFREQESSGASLSARTEPGDDTIVKLFYFEHIAPGQYKNPDQTAKTGTRTRGPGLLME